MVAGSQRVSPGGPRRTRPVWAAEGWSGRKAGWTARVWPRGAHGTVLSSFQRPHRVEGQNRAGCLGDGKDTQPPASPSLRSGPVAMPGLWSQQSLQAAAVLGGGSGTLLLPLSPAGKACGQSASPGQDPWPEVLSTPAAEGPHPCWRPAGLLALAPCLTLRLGSDRGEQKGQGCPIGLSLPSPSVEWCLSPAGPGMLTGPASGTWWALQGKGRGVCWLLAQAPTLSSSA